MPLIIKEGPYIVWPFTINFEFNSNLKISFHVIIGGFSVLAKVVYKYTNISVTYTNAFMNGIVIILGAFFIKFSMILYAILFIFILRYVSERIILGVSSNKTFKIISSKYQRIEKYIHSLGHDVTIYDTVGAYKGGDAKLLMTVVPTS